MEVKNLNSIRNVKRAIEFEADRLINIAENNKKILQETRSFDADNGTTFSLRSKEDADDYRYFPEPDLTPFHITDEFLLKVKNSLPELPEALERKYVDDLRLSVYDAAVICDDKAQVEYFEALISNTTHYKAAANWLLGPVKSYLNEHSIIINSLGLPPGQLAALIGLVEEGQLGFSVAATKIFPALLNNPGRDPLQIATEMNLLQETDSTSIEEWVTAVIAQMPAKVKEYQSGKKGLIGLFAGEIKKMSKGKADMQIVHQLLEEKLKDKQ